MTKKAKRITWSANQKQSVIDVIIENNYIKGTLKIPIKGSRMSWSDFESKCRAKLGAKKYNRNQLVSLCNRIVKETDAKLLIPKYEAPTIKDMFEERLKAYRAKT